jgi:ABC-type phosphate transport system auxiliary subunit
MKRRIATLSVVGAAAAMALVGCSTEARAERKGKEFGEQICKAKNADSVDEAQRHINNAIDKLDDLVRFTGRDVREDLREIDQQLAQIARGNARNQDVNVIVRSVQDAQSSVDGNTSAAYDGMLEALASCD